MILTQLNGGLGNQLFQYAFALRLAQARRTYVKIDRRKVETDPLRSYRLPYLKINVAEASTIDLARFGDPSRRYRWWRDFTARYLPHYSYHVFDEKQLFHYDASLIEQKGNLYIRGYWQQEDYFLPVATQLRQEIIPRTTPNRENQQMAAYMQQVNAVVMHIRRGDYAADEQTRAVHGLLTLSHYTEAVRYLATQLPTMHLFIFSDDPEWCRAQLSFEHPFTIVNLNTSEQDYLDLWLMSHARHFVLANSSFSWWGAWLGARTADSIVIAPPYWQQQPLVASRQVIPARWLVL